MFTLAFLRMTSWICVHVELIILLDALAGLPRSMESALQLFTLILIVGRNMR